jgi:hypothetical protein
MNRSDTLLALRGKELAQIFLAFAQLAALLSPGSSTGSSSGPLLTVIMDFQQPRSPVALSAMEREIEVILQPTGVRLGWRILSDAVSREAFEAVVVARFRGDCRAEGEWELPPTRVLGIAHVTDGQVLPFSDVDCDRVRHFVQPRLATHSPFDAGRLYGRALGRVLGHELYHILAKTTRHARSGLAKPLLNPHELTEGHLNLATHEIEMIRARFGRPTLLTGFR